MALSPQNPAKGPIEHGQGPETPAVVRSSFPRIQLHQGLDGRGLDSDIREAARPGKQVLKESGQSFLEPGFEGHRESLLRAVQRLRGEPTSEHPLQQILLLSGVEPEAGGQSAGKLHKWMIEEWDTCLEGVRHAHPIDLREDVSRKVGAQV